MWELKQLWGLFTDRGGFHIWPAGSNLAAESAEAEEALLPLMRAHFGNRAIRLIYIAATLLVLGAMMTGIVLLVRRILGS